MRLLWICKTDVTSWKTRGQELHSFWPQGIKPSPVMFPSLFNLDSSWLFLSYLLKSLQLGKKSQPPPNFWGYLDLLFRLWGLGHTELETLHSVYSNKPLSTMGWLGQRMRKWDQDWLRLALATWYTSHRFAGLGLFCMCYRKKCCMHKPVSLGYGMSCYEFGW